VKLEDTNEQSRLKLILNFRHLHLVHHWPLAAQGIFVLLKEWIRDKAEGISSFGNLSNRKLGLDKKTGNWYEPSPWDTLKIALNPDTVSCEDVFIDIGSGKGRILYLAARYYSFKRVIGVEISEELNNIARRNIKKNLKKLHCKNVEIITTDISRYVIPDDVTIVYLYNPFVSDVFADFISKLRLSLTNHQRQIRIIYKNPTMHETLIEQGFNLISKIGGINIYDFIIK